MLEILQHPSYGVVLLAVLGLCVGSFINVVILRLPVMLKRQWKEQCIQFLSENDPIFAAETPYSNDDTSPLTLSSPDSRCPKCYTPLRWWHNIPLLSYLLLLGRCANCKTRISIRYPIIELVCGAGTVYLALHFGISWPLAGALIFFWCLLCLTVIDFDHQLLPDDITIPLIWIGLLVNALDLFTDLKSALYGAVAGYLSFWIIFQVHYRITGKEGLGYGDFKLLAAIGAWLGWTALPLVILVASLTGTVVAVAMMALRKLDGGVPISFGPYLSAGGLVAMIWGDTITREYLKILGF